MPGSNNALKTPLATALNRLAAQRSSDAAQALSKSLPCAVVSRKGQVVTVKVSMQSGGVGGPWSIQQLIVPIHTSVYDWLPISKDDLGLLVPSDFYLGGISGLGGGVADYAQRGNLTALAFLPVANSAWVAPGGTGNDMFRIVQGPDGVILQDTDGKTVVKVSKTDITITVQNGQHVNIQDTGGGASLHKVAVDGGTGKSRVLYAFDGG